MLVIGNVTIVDIVIDSLGVLVLGFGRGLFVAIIILEVVAKCGVVAVVDSLEFSIGEEAEDGAEGVIDEAEYGICVDEDVHVGISADVVAVLDGGEEVDHEIDGEEDADEDVDHDDLVAQLVLHDVQQEEKEDPEDRLTQERSRCHKVQNHHYCLHGQQYVDAVAIEGCFFCCRCNGRAQTHL